jgi:hypothetical protein
LKRFLIALPFCVFAGVGTPVAGVVGSLLKVMLAGITAFTVYYVKKKRKGAVTS